MFELEVFLNFILSETFLLFLSCRVVDMSEIQNYLSTEMEEESLGDKAGLLLELIQNYECIYDLKHKDYKNNRKKDHIWAEIASILHTNGKL